MFGVAVGWTSLWSIPAAPRAFNAGAARDLGVTRAGACDMHATMKRSIDRILTTHTGSLPRPEDLTRAMFAREEGVPVGEAWLAEVKRYEKNVLSKRG